jgi:membrane-bound lytic murein transglycosylase D
MRITGRLLMALACVALAIAARSAVGATKLPERERELLPAPQPLRTQIDFWKRVFGTYSSREVVIHDTLRLDRVYEVRDFRPLVGTDDSDPDAEAAIAEQVDHEKERVRAILIRLHEQGGKARDDSDEERKIRALFHDADPEEFLAAAAPDRIRAQRGLRERFTAGVRTAQQYFPAMEAIFEREGVPLSITRLPLVESCFNVQAYSKAGAAGIWQFMPATGRLYMRIDNVVDERRDPIVSTRAAARHLRRNYESLGTWPLAITAYNHGRGGVARAVDTVGTTDIVRIVREYDGPSFKFASRNFYAEFIAALEVEQSLQDAVGPDGLRPLPPTESAAVPAALQLPALARAAEVDTSTLAELNPALSPQVVRGGVPVPKGFRLRVPHGRAAAIENARPPRATRVRSSKRARSGKSVRHRVRAGQSLTSIANRYGTTVTAIERANGLRRGKPLRRGQQLVIPTTR